MLIQAGGNGYLPSSLALVVGSICSLLIFWWLVIPMPVQKQEALLQLRRRVLRVWRQMRHLRSLVLILCKSIPESLWLSCKGNILYHPSIYKIYVWLFHIWVNIRWSSLTRIRNRRSVWKCSSTRLVSFVWKYPIFHNRQKSRLCV